MYGTATLGIQRFPSTCEGSVKKSLKDPDSAQFSDWKAWTVASPSKTLNLSYHPWNGDKAYSAGGMVNAKNGFGGYAGDEMWACDATVSKDGHIEGIANSMNDALKPTG